MLPSRDKVPTRLICHTQRNAIAPCNKDTMQQGRRTNDRRRRVLYSAHQADHEPSSAASRRHAEKLREARCPQMAYGSRVHRRIRGRWFSLVPVRLRSMALVSFSILLLATLLCTAHYAAVTWLPLSSRPMIARPLRLDRPDSFGRWCMVAMLTITAGIALMTYQLRRYRNDDFGGHYRLWRVVILVSVLASINSLASLVDWSGAIIDAAFGKRVALAGSDWVRIVVTFGGAVLTLRMVAELWHCRTALVLMLTSGVLFVIPEAVQWNILKIESAGYWTLATTAPVLGCTTLLIAMLTYLRMLYREVKQVEDISIMDRVRQYKENLFQSEDDAEEPSPANVGKPAKARVKRRWWQSGNTSESRSENEPLETEATEEKRVKPSAAKKQTKASVSTHGEAQKDVSHLNEMDSGMSKRRWFGLRKPKSYANATGPGSDPDSDAATNSAADPNSKTPRKKDKRSLSRSKSVASHQHQDPNKPDAEQNGTEDKPGRKGLMGWRRKKSPQHAETPDAANTKQSGNDEQPSTTKSKPASPQPQNHNEDNSGETEAIDWSSMSKAQRRRLRKQLKRQNKAA